MRRFSIFLGLIICLLHISIPVSAHPGHTDGAGGHTDRSTGEYHYHHGYSAHEHYDMDGDGEVDCPYDFMDNTSKGSSINDSQELDFNEYSSETIPDYTKPLPIKNTPQYEESHRENRHMFIDILSAVFVILTGLFFFAVFAFLVSLYSFPIASLIIYPISYLFFKNNKERRESFSEITAGIVGFVFLLYLSLPSFVDFLLENPINIYVFISFVIIAIAILIFIYHVSEKENEHESTEKWKMIEELRKEKVLLNEEIDKLSLDRLELYTAIDQKERLHKDISNKNTSLQQDIQKAKASFNIMAESNAILRKKIVELQNEIDDLKHKIHLQESGHAVCRPQIQDLPDDVYFINGLPVAGTITDYKPFGRFTVYASKKGSRFHEDEFCGGNILEPVHLFEAIQHSTRCSKCGKNLPDALPNWYTTYKNSK